mgnify:CR=1 FL=1
MRKQRVATLLLQQWQLTKHHSLLWSSGHKQRAFPECCVLLAVLELQHAPGKSVLSVVLNLLFSLAYWSCNTLLALF